MSRNAPKVRPPPLVLVGENDLDTRQMYAEWLIYSGYRVAEASRADDAIEKARTLRPDIITTDIGLQGGKDGCQFCEDLKAYARTKNIPVIAVTAWVMSSHLERARKSGCDSVLVKPCLPETLLVEIQRLLKLPLTPRKE